METNPIQAQITGMIAQLAGIPEETITADAPLSQIGVDSLMALEVVAHIEKYYQIEVPEEEIPKVKTLRDLLNAVSAKVCLSAS